MAEYIYNYTPDDNSGFDGNTGDGGVNGEMSGFTPLPPSGGFNNNGKNRRGTYRVLAIISAVLAFLLLISAAAYSGYYFASKQYDNTQNVEDDNTKAENPSNDKDSADNKGNDKESLPNTPTGIVLKPDSLGTKDKGTIASVVAEVKDSVVEITTEYATKQSFFYTQGAGSGVIISEDGFIITNNHVITDGNYGKADRITVRLNNGKEYKAKIFGTDTDTDITILKIDETGLNPAVIGDSDYLAVGEEIVVIGNPLGELGGTVTNGIISALDREITVENETMNLLQTNAAVNPGNSGGGMFNLAGELVGIINAKYSETGVEGLGFAIPINDVVNVANQILEYGYVKGRVSIGVTVINIDNYYKAMQYRVNALGLYVYDVTEGYNDDVLKPGDRIAIVEGTEITSTADLKAILRKHKVGDTIDATIVRDGKYREIKIKCFERLPSDDVEFGDADN
ncbi:MAG: trypsin-like serine protease [Clostridiales bacterium]|jgi:serine protease Do|nr:trypsin-like serine protease [Clostridiales bacterium]